MSAVFGIEFCPLSQSQLVSEIATQKIPSGGGPRMVVTTNVDHVAHLTQNSAFRRAYKRAWVVTADGMPVFVYARLRGAPNPSRVPGSDLVAELLPALSAADDRIFFVASSWRTGRRLQALLISKGFRRSQVRFASPPFGFEKDEAFSEHLTEQIRVHGTTHLVFGIGAPKSEIWIDRHRGRLGDCYVLCVGAGLDFLAGTKRRAPHWMRKSGLEWSWRLCQEPRRLWHRYVVDAWRFFWAVRDDLVARRS